MSEFTTKIEAIRHLLFNVKDLTFEDEEGWELESAYDDKISTLMAVIQYKNGDEERFFKVNKTKFNPWIASPEKGKYIVRGALPKPETIAAILIDSRKGQPSDQAAPSVARSAVRGDKGKQSMAGKDGEDSRMKEHEEEEEGGIPELNQDLLKELRRGNEIMNVKIEQGSKAYPVKFIAEVLQLGEDGSIGVSDRYEFLQRASDILADSEKKEDETEAEFEARAMRDSVSKARDLARDILRKRAERSNPDSVPAETHRVIAKPLIKRSQKIRSVLRRLKQARM